MNNATRREALLEAARACQSVVDYFKAHNRNPFSAEACVRAIEDLLGEKASDQFDAIAGELYGYMRDGLCQSPQFIAAVIRERSKSDGQG